MAVPAIPASTSGIGANPLVLYNWQPSTQLTHFIAAETKVAYGVPGATATILAIGDSTTSGVGGDPASVNYRQTYSWPAELTAYLSADGIRAQQDNFVGGAGGGIDSRLSLLGGAVASGQQDLGGQMVQTANPGDGVAFTLTTPEPYNQIQLYALTNGGTADVTVTAADGTSISTDVVLPQTYYPSYNNTTTIALPLNTYTSVTITQVGTTEPLFIEGASFSNTLTPQTQVINGGVGGQDSSIGTYSTTGVNQLGGALALDSNIVLIDYGINDARDGNPSPQQTVADVANMVADVKAAGGDPIIIIPEAFGAPDYASYLPVWEQGLDALAIADNVPIIDLSATYGSLTALENAGLMYDGIHPNGTLYSDIGSSIAQLLAGAVQNAKITNLYQQVFDRTPDPGGLSTYVTLLAAGEPLQTIKTTLAFSAEAGNDITNLYQQVLGRAPDPNGFVSKQTELSGGESLTAIRTEMAFSQEEQGDLQRAFRTAYGQAAAPSQNAITAFESTLAQTAGLGGYGATQSSILAQISSEALGTSNSPGFIYLGAGTASYTSTGTGETFAVTAAAASVAATIVDFQPGADTLQFASGLFSGVAAVLAATVTVNGSAVIALPGGHGVITLTGVSPASLTQQDMSFV